MKVRTADITRREALDRKARAAADWEANQGKSGVWEPAHHGAAREVTLADLRLLRGRVLLRVLPEVESTLVLIDTNKTRKDTVGRGVVVAMGAPALHHKGGFEIAPCFEVGDVVFFVGQHKSREVEINETLHVVAQEEIQAVIE